MENRLVLFMFALLNVVAVMLWVSITQAQVPPVSTIAALPDTTDDGSVILHFTVQADNAWGMDGGVGIYWRIPGQSETWNYAGTALISPVIWLAPLDHTNYEFVSTVTDDMGNNEGYEFVPEAWTFVCTDCVVCGDCPPPTVMQATHTFAAHGIFSFGQADVPVVEWYWTHPTSGTPVVYYTLEMQLISSPGDTVTVIFPNLVNMDAEYGYASTPYPVFGEHQRVKVRGCDAEDRSGPWSPWSNWFGDDGPPGVTGQPQGHLVMEEQ